MSKRPPSTRPSSAAGTQKRLNTVRIISGTHRTRKIQFPDAPGLRPTSDRVRETVFNWLRDDISGARCLDLFAGSGALGIEALSRGASWVDFVESNPQVSSALAQSIIKLALGNTTIHRADAVQWVSENKAPVKAFDIVFLDPPFADKLLPKICELLQQTGLVQAKSKIYIEVDAAESELTLPNNWQLLKSKRAGNVSFSLYVST